MAGIRLCIKNVMSNQDLRQRARHLLAVIIVTNILLDQCPTPLPLLEDFFRGSIKNG